MKERLFFIIQLIWGFPQYLMGLSIAFIYRNCPRFSFRCSFVTIWDKGYSMSLGQYIFLTNNPYPYVTEDQDIEKVYQKILVHEYGHSIQSLILGPLYLIVIGIPSYSWGTIPIFHKLRVNKNISYFDLFCEKNANTLGEKVTGLESLGRAF